MNTLVSSDPEVKAADAAIVAAEMAAEMAIREVIAADAIEPSDEYWAERAEDFADEARIELECFAW